MDSDTYELYSLIREQREDHVLNDECDFDIIKDDSTFSDLFTILKWLENIFAKDFTYEDVKKSSLEIKNETDIYEIIFKCLKTGQIETGLEFLKNCNKSWKSFLLTGHLKPIFKDGILKNNQDHLLFRNICKQVGDDMISSSLGAVEKCNEYFIAILGLFSCEPSKVFPVCKTFYDYLFVCVFCAINEQLDRYIIENSNSTHSFYYSITKASIPLSISDILEDLRGKRSELWKVSKNKGKEHEWVVIQTLLMLDQIDLLLKEIRRWVNSGVEVSIEVLSFVTQIVCDVKDHGWKINEDEIVELKDLDLMDEVIIHYLAWLVDNEKYGQIIQQSAMIINKQVRFEFVADFLMLFEDKSEIMLMFGQLTDEFSKEDCSRIILFLLELLIDVGDDLLEKHYCLALSWLEISSNVGILLETYLEYCNRFLRYILLRKNIMNVEVFELVNEYVAKDLLGRFLDEIPEFMEWEFICHQTLLDCLYIIQLYLINSYNQQNNIIISSNLQNDVVAAIVDLLNFEGGLYLIPEEYLAKKTFDEEDELKRILQKVLPEVILILTNIQSNRLEKEDLSDFIEIISNPVLISCLKKDKVEMILQAIGNCILTVYTKE
eukprot:TRINITY_DN3043_c0_g1_i1.p1 TRINITY_DN3043_c0_g1~~TRINITY_DN3043_c0_g1_i1.p1  ORF type:complete len:615 (-),score=166.56 TRINITY_DN3043_c0_g1_i1:64-1878(-)